MKCPNCNGQRYKAPDVPCGRCGGKGVVEPLTNEEWLCSLPTEEKAKWMFLLTYKCYWCGREYAKTKKYNEKECPFHKCLDDSKGFEKWLKEKHNG